MPKREPELTPSRVAMVLLAVMAVIVSLASMVSPRVAILALAAFAIAGAVARLFAPVKRAFMVRRKWIDVGVLVILGAALLYLGMTTQLG